MARTVAQVIVDALEELQVKHVFGVVGDALNPFTDAIRRAETVEWVGCRHEEAAAFAAGAQSQLSGTIGVCMGTVGPGSIHLLNGLYDAAKSGTPVLAIAGQVPLADVGTDYFQEVDNDLLFRDVAVFRATITSPAQLPGLLEIAVRSAIGRGGVAVLTVPGDVGDQEVPDDRPARLSLTRPSSRPDDPALDEAAELINSADRVTLLVGRGARGARTETLALAERLGAPMVLTLKAKEGFEGDNPFEVGQTGLIGNPAAAWAMDHADALVLLGTDFPYRDWYPDGKKVVQVDTVAEHIGRRVPVDVALTADVGPTLRALMDRVEPSEDRSHLDGARERFATWQKAQHRLAAPDHDRGLVGKVRSALDNREHLVRPEALALAINEVAADDAVFTSDTGMATVWLSRFVRMHGKRRLMGSYNLGSMANAMPQALGAQFLDRDRQVVAFCGDGGLSMLLGDLITIRTHRLPVKIIVFDNRRLGMVKLEQEQVGLPEFGTELDNPDFAAVATALGITGIRVTHSGELIDGVNRAFSTPGPVLLDVLTNPEEIAVPAKPTVEQGWGFAIAKVKEMLRSPGETD
ncbi:thiamine pyrophosphate-binding protein [Streptomyces sp. SL13]|uniref:Thiamine pyrophosphate-binding protein n=1 Tax=Streptantibioticus silvisoli TaxID=2705255 RepID=A0AA90HD24_9ACTN|nr:thiamine pyrophosphate-dependent enzyme [Streptantibioticus silvisoli]MDI5965429.1 thiamine pyrophosphate-binding protein [Streptantibioticus silvisoli]MDI5972667.1 thiamine pyrophosphate-binding protein [Streptantibioticus silvisoli]